MAKIIFDEIYEGLNFSTVQPKLTEGIPLYRTTTTHLAYRTAVKNGVVLIHATPLFNQALNFYTDVWQSNVQENYLCSDALSEQIIAFLHVFRAKANQPIYREHGAASNTVYQYLDEIDVKDGVAQFDWQNHHETIIFSPDQYVSTHILRFTLPKKETGFRNILKNLFASPCWEISEALLPEVMEQLSSAQLIQLDDPRFPSYKAEQVLRQRGFVPPTL